MNLMGLICLRRLPSSVIEKEMEIIRRRRVEMMSRLMDYEYNFEISAHFL